MQLPAALLSYHADFFRGNGDSAPTQQPQCPSESHL